MAGFNDVLKQIGYGVGIVTGGPSQVKAVAGAVSVQGKINDYLNQFGKKLGGSVGADLFKKIAGGAEVTADAETKAFVEKNILTNQARRTISIVGLILFLIVGYYFYKGK